ncbi:MAG: YraN family protein [Gemmataceae bacterium]
MFWKPSWWKKWFGDRSEGAAVQFFRQRGCRILKRNYSCKHGELDIVALDEEGLIFVEVRSTSQGDPYLTAESIDWAKEHKLTLTAHHFIQRYQLHEYCGRFDVLIIQWPPGQNRPKFTHYPNAFEATE